MCKKIFNYLVHNSLEKFIVIACFLALGSLISLQAASPVAYNAGLVANAAPTPTAPVWGKLVLSGNTVTCYYALGTATPKTWTQIGVAQTINFLNNPILIGLYITSHDTTVVTTGTIDNFAITPAPKYRLVDYDIGAPPLMGSANLINGVWNLSAVGPTSGTAPTNAISNRGWCGAIAPSSAASLPLPPPMSRRKSVS